ncbi:lysophospholipase [Mycobacterium kyorinense]|uniref:Lysophospholipase n=1 Tax=Mycobacterium kyorinense TaxID=487514 RepID=A0A1A2Z587_9MYCO|nr:SGNH/GDSL hydrolase family protein [Mycobacterium kyorinense]OBI44336.1 lysophospholipase [Mycobacterium kyorinense]
MSGIAYRRYVAIGDSQTEGLWDGDDTVGLTGFADRLASRIDAVYPGLQYANLAVRGRRISDVLHDQLPNALMMRPDLITVCAGMNDVTRPGRSFDQALADLNLLYTRLAESGATVLTTTFPDVAKLVPVGRLLASRVARINDVIRAAAARHGFGLVDLFTAASMHDLDTWSADRIHASTKGHILFAAAAAEALKLPSSNHDWARSDGVAAPSSLSARAAAQVRWTQNLLLPWMWRQLRGRSTGDGREPKRPSLDDVTARRRAR